ncbi:MAG: hypothetical protein IKO35_04265, partial [Elusimicrobiaceae bacterium]|nr:hypothetical protein [Elusimicrobiaceae bacterium]
SGFAFSLFGRMHGGILALNSGVPAVVVNTDLRAREMCRLFNIPHRPGLTPTRADWRAVYEETDFEPTNKCYPALYTRFMQWLEKQGLGEEVLRQAHAWAAQQPSWQEPQLHKNMIHRQIIWKQLQNYQFYIPSKILVHKLLEKKILPALGKIGLLRK